MKKKSVLAGILIMVIIVIIYGMFTVNMEREYLIKVKRIEGFNSIIERQRDVTNKIKNTECKNSIFNLIDNIDQTYFESDVSINEYYHAYYGDTNFLELYSDVASTCKLKKKVSDDIYVIALASTNFPNKVKEQYLSSYEFKYDDKVLDKILLKSDDEVGTYTTKNLELKVLNDILEEV